MDVVVCNRIICCIFELLQTNNYYKMIRDFKGEIWLPYANDLWSDEDEYLISNFGRVQRKKKYF